jgi:hypothetical protein
MTGSLLAAHKSSHTFKASDSDTIGSFDLDDIPYMTWFSLMIIELYANLCSLATFI